MFTIGRLLQLRFFINKRKEKRETSKQRVLMIAIITKGGSIVSIGINKKSRKKYKWKLHNRYHPEQGLHAEMSAILKAKKNLKDTTIYVFGLTRSGNILKNSKPCSSCLNAIKAKGIKKVIYTEQGQIVAAKVRNLLCQTKQTF